MLRLFFITAFFLNTIVNLIGQEHDANWLISTAVNGIYPRYCLVDFNQQPPLVTPLLDQAQFAESPMACSDSLGNLLFYFNGLSLKNRLSQDMSGADSIVNLDWHGRVGAFALPYPEQANKYCYFHTESMIDGLFPAPPDYFYVSVIDMNADNGLGAVVSSDQLLLVDSLLKVSACKHGNGRDWWIIAPVMSQARFYLFLLSPEGLEGPFIQDFPFAIGQDFVPDFHSSISPDGASFIRFHTPDTLALYRFDRCEGLFDFVGSTSTPPIYRGNGTFAQESRMFFLTDKHNLFHLDICAWPRGIDTLRLSGPIAGPLFRQVKELSLARDGRIYVMPGSGVGDTALHVIHRPDFPPSAADFAYGAFDLGGLNAGYLPNFPNYRLGILEGSACDTLPQRPFGRNVAFEHIPFKIGFSLQYQRGKWDKSKAIRQKLFKIK